MYYTDCPICKRDNFCVCEKDLPEPDRFHDVIHIGYCRNCKTIKFIPGQDFYWTQLDSEFNCDESEPEEIKEPQIEIIYGNETPQDECFNIGIGGDCNMKDCHIFLDGDCERDLEITEGS